MKTSIKKFYQSKSWEQPHKLEVKVKGYSDLFSIDLVGSDQQPDCMIGHFGYNCFVRTNKGIQSQEYKSLKSCFSAIKRKLLDEFEGIYIVRGSFGSNKRKVWC